MLFLYTIIILFGESFILPKDQAKWCKYAFVANTKEYENPDYNKDLCRYQQTYYLLYMTVDECDYARRMLLSVIFGAIIGFERRSADRPAGIRTMGLVSLGSCFFTMCGMNAFRSSTMHWDAARVSAAIPSGVGFLGAGLIWKGTESIGDGERHEVHGLATAAGVWLSAAVGVGVGGKLYIPSAYAVVLVVFMLRIGPRLYLWDSDGSAWSDDLAGWESETEKDDSIDDTDDEGTSEVVVEVPNSRSVGLNKASVVTQEERQWLLERESSIRSTSFKCPIDDNCIRTQVSLKKEEFLDHHSTHSLPVEAIVPMKLSDSDNDEGTSIQSGINGNYPERGRRLHRVHSQPILRSLARYEQLASAVVNYPMRKSKSEAEFLIPVRDKRSKSRRRRGTSKTLRRKPKHYKGPIFVN